MESSASLFPMVSFSPDFDGFAFTAMCSTCQRATSLVLAAVAVEDLHRAVVEDHHDVGPDGDFQIAPFRHGVRLSVR